MCKKVLRMASDAEYIDQAVTWSRELTRMKSRGPGDTENALRSIEREYGIDYGFLWSLRYRRQQLKVISKPVFERIAAAYRTECERQVRKLRHEIEITEAIAGSDDPAVVAAKAALDEATGE